MILRHLMVRIIPPRAFEASCSCVSCLTLPPESHPMPCPSATIKFMACLFLFSSKKMKHHPLSSPLPLPPSPWLATLSDPRLRPCGGPHQSCSHLRPRPRDTGPARSRGAALPSLPHAARRRCPHQAVFISKCNTQYFILKFLYIFG